MTLETPGLLVMCVKCKILNFHILFFINTSENCIEFMIPKEWNVKINTMCIEKFEKGCNELLEERFGNWSNLTVIGVSAFLIHANMIQYDSKILNE